MSAVTRALRVFGRFWLDFLVGDTPEIFFGVCVIVASALCFRHERVVGLLLAVVLAVVVLIGATVRGRTRS